MHFARKSLSILIFSLLLAVGIISSSVRVSADDSGKMVKSSEANDTKLEVFFPAVVKNGQPVDVHVRLTNRGKQILYYMAPGNLDFGILVTDAKKGRVPLTELGIRTFIGYGHDRYEAMEPGETRDFKILLGDYFKLFPGKYFISTDMALGRPLPGAKKYDLSKVKGFELSIEGASFEIQ